MEKFQRWMAAIRTSTHPLLSAWGAMLLLLYFFIRKLVVVDGSVFLLIWAVGSLSIIWVKRRPRTETSSRASGRLSMTSDLLYHAIAETSPDSVSVVDLTGKIIFCSKQTAILHQYESTQELIGKSAFRLFPYRDSIRIAEILRDSENGGMIKNIEFDMLKKDGTIFPAELSASLIRDRSGTPLAYLAIARDITERKWMEAQIHERDSLYRVVADNTYDWEFWQAPNQRFIYISPSCKRISGYDAAEFIKDPDFFINMIHPEDRQKYIKHAADTSQLQIPGEIEFRIRRAGDQNERWISHVCQPVFDKAGKFIGTRGSNRDITDKKVIDNELRSAYDLLRSQFTEIEQLQSTLREQAVRDTLTGLYNRRYLEEALRQEYSRAVREGHQLSVVMVDLDHLKQINDTCGHMVGDKVLQQLSEQFKSMTRVEDIVCRYGGDEFLIIMHNMPAKEALKRVEDWRSNFEAAEIPGGEKILKTTFTAGIASFQARDKTMNEIIHIADTALYQAKLKGRNNTVLIEKIN